MGYRPVAPKNWETVPQADETLENSWNISQSDSRLVWLIIVFVLGAPLLQIYRDSQTTAGNDVNTGQEEKIPQSSKNEAIHPDQWKITESHLDNQELSTLTPPGNEEILGRSVIETGGESQSPNKKEEEIVVQGKEDIAEAETKKDNAATIEATSNLSQQTNYADSDVSNNKNLIREMEKLLERWQVCVGDASTNKTEADETFRIETERAVYWRTEAMRTESVAAKAVALFFEDAAAAWRDAAEKWEAVMKECHKSLVESDTDVKEVGLENRLNGLVSRANNVTRFWIEALDSKIAAELKSKKAVDEEKTMSVEVHKDILLINTIIMMFELNVTIAIVNASV
ncbi:unnamed protein product [Darwinula stevensoni]|uniref:Uncharacterized protein n=1 Tax=Darwinula stevensoni TaxID=69355 RepID=A0A7R9FRF0_9CRUS|nr:unnamed protein product [Darwinula stevensoni]CAG0901537.1 unnamed protein product [Darwinula stevensoni]